MAIDYFSQGGQAAPPKNPRAPKTEGWKTIFYVYIFRGLGTQTSPLVDTPSPHPTSIGTFGASNRSPGKN